MTSRQKLAERVRTCPSDLKWLELVRFLEMLGYREHSRSGSRRAFIGEGLPRLRLHRPHPADIVKQYVIRQVLETLEQEKVI